MPPADAGHLAFVLRLERYELVPCCPTRNVPLRICVIKTRHLSSPGGWPVKALLDVRRESLAPPPRRWQALESTCPTDLASRHSFDGEVARMNPMNISTVPRNSLR